MQDSFLTNTLDDITKPRHDFEQFFETETHEFTVFLSSVVSNFRKDYGIRDGSANPRLISDLLNRNQSYTSSQTHSGALSSESHSSNSDLNTYEQARKKARIMLGRDGTSAALPTSTTAYTTSVSSAYSTPAFTSTNSHHAQGVGSSYRAHVTASRALKSKGELDLTNVALNDSEDCMKLDEIFPSVTHGQSQVQLGSGSVRMTSSYANPISTRTFVTSTPMKTSSAFDSQGSKTPLLGSKPPSASLSRTPLKPTLKLTKGTPSKGTPVVAGTTLGGNILGMPLISLKDASVNPLTTTSSAQITDKMNHTSLLSKPIFPGSTTSDMKADLITSNLLFEGISSHATAPDAVDEEVAATGDLSSPKQIKTIPRPPSSAPPSHHNIHMTKNTGITTSTNTTEISRSAGLISTLTSSISGLFKSPSSTTSKLEAKDMREAGAISAVVASIEPTPTSLVSLPLPAPLKVEDSDSNAFSDDENEDMNSFVLTSPGGTQNFYSKTRELLLNKDVQVPHAARSRLERGHGLNLSQSTVSLCASPVNASRPGQMLRPQELATPRANGTTHGQSSFVNGFGAVNGVNGGVPLQDTNMELDASMQAEAYLLSQIGTKIEEDNLHHIAQQVARREKEKAKDQDKDKANMTDLDLPALPFPTTKEEGLGNGENENEKDHENEDSTALRPAIVAPHDFDQISVKAGPQTASIALARFGLEEEAGMKSPDIRGKILHDFGAFSPIHANGDIDGDAVGARPGAATQNVVFDTARVDTKSHPRPHSLTRNNKNQDEAPVVYKSVSAANTPAKGVKPKTDTSNSAKKAETQTQAHVLSQNQVQGQSGFAMGNGSAHPNANTIMSPMSRTEKNTKNVMMTGENVTQAQAAEFLTPPPTQNLRKRYEVLLSPSQANNWQYAIALRYWLRSKTPEGRRMSTYYVCIDLKDR